MTTQANTLDIHEDEFSIRDFFSYLWKNRLWLALVPVLCLSVGMGMFLFNSSTPAALTLYIELKGIEKGAYANGAKFTPGDLIVADVVDELRAKYDNAFSPEEFSKAVVVEYGTLLVRPLVQRYETLLANKQLKPSELEDLSNKLSKELESIAQRGLRIRIAPHELNLTREQAAQLALDIPVVWNQIFAEKYNIFLDKEVMNYDVAEINPDLTRLKDILTVNSATQAMLRSLAKMKSDPRLQALKSKEGSTAGELEASLANFATVSFQPILSSVMQQSNLPGVELYKKEVRIRLREVDNKIAGLDQSIGSILSNRDSRSANSAAAVTGAGSFQLMDNGIEQLLKLGQQSANAVYLQGLLTKRIELTDSRAALQSEVERLDVVTKSDVTPAFTQDAQTKFMGVASAYKSLVQLVIARLKSSNERMYSVVGAPTSEASGLAKLAVVWMAGAFLLGAALVLGVLAIRFGFAQRPSQPRDGAESSPQMGEISLTPRVIQARG